MSCIDLRQLAGRRYRLGHEHRPDVRATDDPWLLTILARHGHFYPHGDKLLGFATNGRGPIARQLAALPFVQVTQDASDGINLVFPGERFGDVAKIVKPRRRRRLTPEHKAKLLAAGKPFKKGASKARQNELVRVLAG